MKPRPVLTPEEAAEAIGEVCKAVIANAGLPAALAAPYVSQAMQGARDDPAKAYAVLRAIQEAVRNV